jgi:Fe2+ transport system protein FeoA
MKLSTMPLHKEAVITKVGGERLLRCRLLDMGLIPKTKIQICHVAPLGDPIEIRIRNYTLTLRKEDADNIEVLLPEARGPEAQSPEKPEADAV